MEDVEAIIERSQRGAAISLEEIEALLSIEEPNSLDKLFNAALKVKERHFGNKVFFYGFVYFSTHCRNDCSFCFYRRSNQKSYRYRKNDEEVLSLATSLADSGVHAIDLTMGEDPGIHHDDQYQRLLDLVRMVNDAVDTPLMLSPGALPHRVFTDLRDAGVDWFACYQETHNRELFCRLRPDQNYDLRLLQKKWAREVGILAEEGIMVGVGGDHKRSCSLDHAHEGPWSGPGEGDELRSAAQHSHGRAWGAFQPRRAEDHRGDASGPSDQAHPRIP